MGRRAIAAMAARIAIGLALAAALASCQSAPPRPLMSPLDPAKRYGYSDRELAPDRIEVTYVGPRHRVPSFGGKPREADAQKARDEALDLALWRAAEIAPIRGYKGFRGVDRRVDLDSRPEAFYPGSDWGAWPYWRYPNSLIYGPPGYYSAPSIEIQARATLTVQLSRDLQPGDEDATALIERMRRAHPGAAEATAPEIPPPVAPVR